MKTHHDVEFNLAWEKAEFNQYWYSPHTIKALLEEVRHHATACAFLSTPSLYFELVSGNSVKDNNDNNNTNHNNNDTDKDAASDASSAAMLAANSRLFEFDRQWEKQDSGFVFYDFHKPDHVPVQYLGAFDYVMADPPFITEDVWTAYVRTALLLLRPGGKLLFTTVLENHAMLEGLLDGPLFIAPFRPVVMHLTYQYVCFTNYRPTRLARVNSELPPEDPKITAATQMANDLRESEKEFAAQMRQRDRRGEQPLPAAQRESGEMKWGYIPAGLTMYAGGGDAPPTEEDAVDYGDVYREIEALRETLGDFKRHIDLAQRDLDVLLRLHQRRSKLEKDEKLSAADASIAEAKQQFATTLDEMQGIIATVQRGEQRLAGNDEAEASLSYIATMKECIEAYRTVPIQRRALNEIAADATRKYKSPVFTRMNELLQQMKEIKKQKQQNTTSTTTLTEEKVPN